jgi:antitoxin CptB
MMDDENGGSFGARRKRLLFRAQRRGFKEVDLIFGTFAAAELGSMTDTELDAFEALMTVPDQEIYAWLQGAISVPPGYDTPIFRRMQLLCGRKEPKWTA